MGKLARTIDSLLFLARSSGSLAHVDGEDLDLALETDDVIEYHLPQAAEKDIDIRRDGTASIRGDRALFRRAMSNLLSNAIHASNEGGLVTVSIQETTSGVTVRVIDKGVGIAAEELPHAFERFYRSAAARASRPEGSGLGLAIVKSIAELHGGQVSIESTVGQGTTVTLDFSSGT